MLAILVLALVSQEWEDITGLSHWEATPGWRNEEGTIVRADKGGNLFTKEHFGDFIVRLEFKLPRGGNSGLIFRSRDNVEHQVEILADAGGRPQTGSSGSIFRRAAPRVNASKPAGEWNRLELEVRGRSATVTYNGVTVVERATVDDLPWRGPIGLQDHGTPLWFRKVEVKRLGKPAPPPAKPLTAEETRAFMKKLAQYVFDRHLKKDSEQKGMIYEYFDPARKGQVGQWIQGEALDTMHDGAWFARGLVNAYRATGDPFYKEFLAEWVLPFYVKMLNHSGTLFSAEQDDVAPEGHRFGREHRLQEGEKGFVPYFWDDGASVSLEAMRKKTGKAPYSCTDRLAGRPNPEMRLSGWSHGSSNHMAQDLGVMLQQAWLLLGTPELAEAARNLQECRARHGSPSIPACVAPAAFASKDAGLLRKIGLPKEMEPSNHYTRCLAPADPAKDQATPGFADDDEYDYNAAIARAGGELPRPAAFRLVYNAYTNPMLFRYLSDAEEVPPGMNRFDLGGALPFRGGKPTIYRSDRELGRGSRFGPQNMIVCGLALQALKAYPGLWEERYRTRFAGDLRVRFLDEGRHYTINGNAESGSSDPVTLGPATLRLASHRSALLVAGSVKGDSVTIRIVSADVTLRKDRTWQAVNAEDEPLRLAAHVLPNEEGFAFEFALPYTVVKDQKPWANGVEHFRYTVAVGEDRRSFYLASTEDQVQKALLRELGQGLRTWERVFSELGYVPTGIGAGPRWDKLSDSGGYAHLLAAGAQYLLYLEGKRDWELQKIPRME